MTEEEPQQPATLATRATRLYRSAIATPQRIAMSGAVAVAVLAGLVVTVVWSMPYSDSEQVVVDYVDAIAAGDAAKARELGGGIPGQPDAAIPEESEIDESFLTEKAINPDLYIESIAETGAISLEDDEFEIDLLESWKYEGKSEMNAVNVTIGGGNHDPVAHRFVTVRDEESGEWELRDPPYAIVTLPSHPLEVVEINGHTEKVSEHARTFALFPGVYDFFGGIKDYFAVEPETTLLLPGETAVNWNGTDGSDKNAPLTVSEETQEKTQQLVEEHIDDCVAEAEPMVPECPFGIDMVEDSAERHDIGDVTWEVVEYPQVTVVHQDEELEIVDRERGTVEATGTAVAEDGSEFDYEAECDVSANVFMLALPAEDDPRLTFTDDMQRRIDDEHHLPLEWHTC